MPEEDQELVAAPNVHEDSRQDRIAARIGPRAPDFLRETTLARPAMAGYGSDRSIDVPQPQERRNGRRTKEDGDW
jgi:hypothetical protein